MTMQKISIITINYNNREGLRCTIESVLTQTYREVEYIIIDGGSEDGSAELVEEYKRVGRFERFRRFYSCSEHDGGIYFGMNKGFAQATGDYLLFLNSGDRLVGKRVLEDIFGSEDYAEDLVVGRQLHYNRLHLPCARRIREKIDKHYLYHDTLPHQCTFIHRQLLEKTNGYHTDYRVVSDWIFMYEAVVNHRASVRLVDTVVAIQEVGGVSNDLSRCVREVSAYLAANHPTFATEDWVSLMQAYSQSSAYTSATRSRLGRFLVKIALWINK